MTGKLTLESWITATPEQRKEQLKAMIDQAEAAKAEQDRIIEWATAQLNEIDPTEHKVRWVNTDNLSGDYPASVVVHSAECQHLVKIAKEPEVLARMEEISDIEKWTSAEAFAKDYNADFYDEAGMNGCWSIAFYPCTGMVDTVTTMTGYDS